MDKVLRLLLTVALCTGLAGSSLLAQTLRLIPVPPGVKPQWRAVQGAPKVSFAPNIPTDVFRYRGRYYLFWDGAWFESRTLQGPWDLSRKAPRVLGRIHPSYFKTAGRGPSGPAVGQRPPGAFQPPAPPGAGRRDPFSVPGVAPPPGWKPPAGSGMAEPIAPADVTPPAGPPPALPERGPVPEAHVPKAM